MLLPVSARNTQLHIFFQFILVVNSYAQEKLTDFVGLPIGVSCKFTEYLPNIPLTPIKGVSSSGKIIEVLIYQAIKPSLYSLIDQAAFYNIHLEVRSAYRSYQHQAKIYSSMGSHTAEAPGYSEHHIGTAVDFGHVNEDSRTFLWLLEFGIQKGWIPTYYYRSSTDIHPEPWHWRYVGKKAAYYFYQQWKREIERDKLRLNKLYGH